MDCPELLDQLNEYLSEELSPEICGEFEEHLKKCNPCRVVVDNLKGTVQLYRGEEPFPLPEAFQRRLHALLRERWNRRSSSLE